jgi:UDP-N-acetylmuramate--alanine ligase
MYSTRQIHFIGICGSGMSPLAEIAVRVGFNVSGSDQSSSPEGDRLSALGIRFFRQHQAANLGDAKTVVYSSAIPADNPELRAAKQRSDIELLHRSDFLSELLSQNRGITVAGTHGKTTSSAMIAHMLKNMGLDPSAAVGGKLLGEESYCLVGDGDLFVAESDESDGSLLKYKPLIGVLTNIAKDHMDFYRDESHIYDTFRQYLENIIPDGFAIIGWDNAISRALGNEYSGQKLAYGFSFGSDVRGREFSVKQDGISFIAQVERDAVSCFVPTLGKINAVNALCALSVARALELDIKKAAASLGTFRGVGRRLNILFNAQGLRVVDDYAHNPDKIEAAIAAVKDAWPDSFLIVCFQPHRYTRISSLFKEFAAAFKRADQVLVVPVYGAGEEIIDGYSSEAIATEIGLLSKVVALGVSSFSACCENILGAKRRNCSVLTVGAGDIWKVGELLKEASDE